MKRLLMGLLLALALPLSSHAAADASRHLLTAATLQKIQAADAEMKKQPSRKSESESEREDSEADDETVEDIARRIDRDPKLKALLARHGLSSMEFALSVHAMLHAGAYLMFEKSMDKKKAAATYAGYTAEQRANIELLRKSAAKSR